MWEKSGPLPVHMSVACQGQRKTELRKTNVTLMEATLKGHLSVAIYLLALGTTVWKAVKTRATTPTAPSPPRGTPDAQNLQSANHPEYSVDEPFA